MTLVAANLLHGGGPSRTPNLVLALVAMRPDVLILSEFRSGRGGAFRAALADHGLVHQVATCGTGSKGNGVLIASRYGLAAGDAAPEGLDRRWAEVEVQGWGLRVAGVHVPDDAAGPDKPRFWRHVVEYGRRRGGSASVVMGDFNTDRDLGLGVGGGVGGGWRGRRGSSRCGALMGALESLGYVDAWAARNAGVSEATWAGNALCKGARIDRVYVSAGLAGRVEEASHDHGARDAGLTDHSMLVLRLRMQRTAAGTASGCTGRAAASLWA